MKKLYIVFIFADVDPVLHGPFFSEDDRNEKVFELRREHGECCGYYPLDIDEHCIPSITGYAGGFFDEVDGE